MEQHAEDSKQSWNKHFLHSLNEMLHLDQAPSFKMCEIVFLQIFYYFRLLHLSQAAWFKMATDLQARD